MPTVHLTASVYLFAHRNHDWLLGLIKHPRLGDWMIPGGHVEDEMPSDAAVRETLEETGRTPRLLTAPSLQLPQGYPHPRIASPWWIVRMPVAADGHLSEPHIHEDHQYVALDDHSGDLGGRAEHPFRWASTDELGHLPIPTGTRTTANYLLALFREHPGLLTGQTGILLTSHPTATRP
ncbi:NUDIX domain-containing protein [Microbispora sp. NBRC 16548]|uniref:NUDIX domain-containing protein n=1 Tax=Microbispora sp. NBRC 16548 TaxID=3030994 RepID=UPI0024A02EE1|nr:NUDIX domain-containing protein [Microbispora sp. NBRC 16548]GLX06592.1 hypothetical protein Misp03_35190 [Microbispora sp. NBRC 16548]